MAARFSCGASQRSSGLFRLGKCSSGGQLKRPSSCCGLRASFGVGDSHWVREEIAGQTSINARSFAAITFHGRDHFHKSGCETHFPKTIEIEDLIMFLLHPEKIVPYGGRSAFYEDVDSYVLMEPGEEEQFVTLGELQVRLKSWLVKWPENELPEDLQHFDSLDEVVTHLIDAGCELDLRGGLGSIQWFQVRLEA